MQMVKSIIFIMLIIGCFKIAATAQIRKIPAAVTEALQSKYPSAERVEWSDKVAYFLASFDSNDTNYFAKFDSKGLWLGSQMLIDQKDIPQDVKEGFDKSKFSEWIVLGYYKLYLPEEKIQYRIQVKKNDLEKRNLIFNANGKLVKDSFTF